MDSIKNAQDLNFIYICKRDRDHRPTLVVDCTKLVPVIEKFSEKEIEDCVAFTLAYAIDNLLMPGKVETLNMVFDITEISVIDAPIKLLKRIANQCAQGYPTRINRTFVIGLGFFSRSAYKIFS